MKKAKGYGFAMMILVMGISLASWFCDKKKEIAQVPKKKMETLVLSFDSSLVSAFYAKYPKLVLYKSQVVSLYEKNKFDFI